LLVEDPRGSLSKRFHDLGERVAGRLAAEIGAWRAPSLPRSVDRWLAPAIPDMVNDVLLGLPESTWCQRALRADADCQHRRVLL